MNSVKSTLSEDVFKKCGKQEKLREFTGEGYGLGLSIVKSIVSFHGFEINVTSTYQKGSIFSIVIPDKMVELLP